MSQLPSLTRDQERQRLRLAPEVPTMDILQALYGWLASPERYSKFRPLLPHLGRHESINSIGTGYPICTDGVHIIVWSASDAFWTEISYDNWNGKLEPLPNAHKPTSPFLGGMKAMKPVSDKPPRQTKAYQKANPGLFKVLDSDVDDLV